MSGNNFGCRMGSVQESAVNVLTSNETRASRYKSIEKGILRLWQRDASHYFYPLPRTY
uniref:Uncharacterized protein n=1 Tax=Moniliophthora roreri TaxID=221103 RepID=A0A0W0FCY6_MONRR